MELLSESERARLSDVGAWCQAGGRVIPVLIGDARAAHEAARCLVEDRDTHAAEGCRPIAKERPTGDRTMARRHEEVDATRDADGCHCHRIAILPRALATEPLRSVAGGQDVSASVTLSSDVEDGDLVVAGREAFCLVHAVRVRRDERHAASRGRVTNSDDRRDNRLQCVLSPDRAGKRAAGRIEGDVDSRGVASAGDGDE